MALNYQPDDEDEFGWDLTAEDEELLTTLVDSTELSFATQPDFPPYRPNTPGSASDTTITTITTDRRPKSRRVGKRRSTLRDDIHPAFPLGPTTESITDVESGADAAPRDIGFGYKHGAGFPTQQRRVSTRNRGRRGQESPVFHEASTDISEDVSYPDLSNALSTLDPPPEDSATDPEAESVVEPKTEPDEAAATPAAGFTPPTRSPLARFRTFPRKPFSVTDFSSAAWCELQHEYTLTHLPGGRKTRNEAMKGGSRVHQKLEDEVHRTVRIDVMSKEDAFGLKLWNIIQGLRTLRDEGLTRELEVWGLVDGHVVNGLIDGLVTENPDPEFEADMLGTHQVPEMQPEHTRKITDFFGTTKQQPLDNLPPDRKSPFDPQTLPRRVWLTDVKTRGHMSLPSGPVLRSTMIQLFTYHRFLSVMAACQLDYLHVYRRYGLDPDELFSDVFLAQIGGLHDEVFQDATTEIPVSPASSAVSSSARRGGRAGGGGGEGTNGSTASASSAAMSTSSSNERIRYRTLRSLIPLLNAEMRQTFPHGAASLGPVVTVEYRYRGRRITPTTTSATAINTTADDSAAAAEDVGRIIGDHKLLVDDEKLSAWLDKHMEWWRGERAAEGVPIEEADKCRGCEFADRCEWRAENHLKLVAMGREKRAAGLARKWRKYP